VRIFFIAFGQSIHTIKWVKHFADSGNQVMLVTFYQPQPIANADIRYIDSSNRNLVFLKTKKVNKLLSEFHPDIVHAHYASSCGLVAALTGFHPFVLSVWGDDILEFPRKSPIHKLVIKSVLKRADYITATSNMLAEKTRELAEPYKEIKVIPFGVDLNKFKPERKSTSGKIVIGTARAFTPKYGLEYLIKAFAQLRQKYSNIKLTLIGDGPLRQQLASLADSLGVTADITFTGAIPNDEVAVKLRGFDIFVMPSVGEGDIFGVAAVEAMASRLPVVATKVGGLPEVVDDGRTGRIVEPANVDSLAKGLESYILSEELRLSHGMQGRAKVENQYDWSQNANSMAELYRTILSRRKKATPFADNDD
jgi:L-malate glycosyltransferase